MKKERKSNVVWRILQYHAERWREEFQEEMAISKARDGALIKQLLELTDEATILRGIERLFKMWARKQVDYPTVGNLRCRWNEITVELKRSELSEFRTRV